MSNTIIVKGYKLEGKIDEIGLKTIYRALHLKSSKHVFMTVIPVRQGRSLTTLTTRACQSQKLPLPTLVSAIDYGLVNGSEGQEYFYYTHKAQTTLPITRVLAEIQNEEQRQFTTIRFIIQALGILDYIHEAQTTHRDLTVSHLRVAGRGQLILEGFVNARAPTESRSVANIVHLPYLAPEQINGARADRKTDIYSMGVILYELLTGALPYASNYAKLEDARLGAVPDPSKHKIDLPHELEMILMKALSGRPSRYSHVRQLISDLECVYNRRSLWIKFKGISSTIKQMFSHAI